FSAPGWPIRCPTRPGGGCCSGACSVSRCTSAMAIVTAACAAVTDRPHSARRSRPRRRSPRHEDRISGPGPQGLVGSLAAGAIHVVSGTHGVQVIDQIAAAHRAAHQVLVTCHVLGRPDLAASGKLGLVPAGPPDALRALQPLFAVLGERIFEAGEDPLAATALKVANNYVLGCAIEAIGEGMAMVRKYGVDPQVFYRVLVEGLFDCTAYRAYADIIAKMDWGRIGATAVIGLKDAVLSRQAADKVHMTLPSLAAWQTHLAHAIARGEANLDWSVMAREQF